MSRTQVINIPTTCPIFNLCPAGTAPDSRAFFTPAVQTGSTNFLGSYRLVRSRHAEKVGTVFGHFFTGTFTVLHYEHRKSAKLFIVGCKFYDMAL